MSWSCALAMVPVSRWGVTVRETTSRPAERTLTPRDIHSVKLTSINQSTYDALPDKEKPLLIVTKIRVLNGSVEDYYDI